MRKAEGGNQTKKKIMCIKMHNQRTIGFSDKLEVWPERLVSKRSVLGLRQQSIR